MSLRVSLGERSYPIIVANTYGQLPDSLRQLGLPTEGWIISHQRLLAEHGPALLGSLRRRGFRLRALTVPESESSKSLEVAQRLLARLSRQATMRPPLLIAFGGGVVGDLAGFVAAVFRRGVPYVQVPTTLLAQVDSAIGGKVGVDVPEAKNLIGAFYQPRLVYNNIAVLRTLPIRQRRSGLAEVIKYGVMADRALFAFLETHREACLSLEPRAVRVMVERSCRIKARIVSADERESHGARVRLNFGHTVGHAIEAATAYRRYTHGEAIAIGMCAAADLAVALGRCVRGDFERLGQLTAAVGLPTRARGVALSAVLRALRHDKKFLHGRPRWVLPVRIGQVVVTEEVPVSLMHRVIRRYVG